MIISNYTNADDTYGTVVYLQKPMKRVINVDMEHGPNKYTKGFFLSIPYVFFRIVYLNRGRYGYHTYDRHMCVGFGINENPNVLFRPPFPNIFSDLNVCFPTPQTGFASLEELCKTCIKAFWSSEFSYVPDHDYAYSGMYCGHEFNPHKVPNSSGYYPATSDQYLFDSLMGDHRKWEEKTKAEPDWVPDQNDMIQCHILNDSFLHDLAKSVKIKYLARNNDSERRR